MKYDPLTGSQLLRAGTLILVNQELVLVLALTFPLFKYIFLFTSNIQGFSCKNYTSMHNLLCKIVKNRDSKLRLSCKRIGIIIIANYRQLMRQVNKQ